MPDILIRKRSYSLGDLPIPNVKKDMEKIISHDPTQGKKNLIFDGTQKRLDFQKDLPPNYDELEHQIKNLNHGKNLEKFLKEFRIKLPEGVNISGVKDKLREFENKFSTNENEVPSYKRLEAKLEDFKEDGYLEGWLDNLEHKPKDLPMIKQKLQDYFKTKEGQVKVVSEPQAKTKDTENIVLIKSSNVIPGKLWSRFMALSPIQKTAIVAGITVLAAGAGILTWTLIGAAFPPVLALVQGQLAGFFAEFAFEMNRIRSEISFNLLALRVDQAKPLSRAWRDQFIIWKYV